MEDASFIMLDTFARGDWRTINRDYESGKITVGRFNSDAFALVAATRQQLLESIKGKVHIRPGFEEFADYCRRKGFRLVIVSNGLDFYIREILRGIGLEEVETHAALTTFAGDRMSVSYVGPDGTPLDDAFKEAHVKRFREQGYRVFYVGNGSSDFKPAMRSDLVFATGTLLEGCRGAGMNCAPFEDFHDVIRKLDSMRLM